MNLAHRHAPCVKRQNLVVKAAPAGLVLGDKLRLEHACAVAGNLNGQFVKVAFERFLAAPVASVARFVGDHLVLAVAQVAHQLGLQCPLNQSLGQLLHQTVLTNQGVGLRVVFQQGIYQVVG